MWKREGKGKFIYFVLTEDFEIVSVCPQIENTI